MKKIITLLILVIFLSPLARATVGTPALDFDLSALNSNTNNNSSSDDHDGLSGGAVTAITLGSVAGAGLLALGGVILKRKLAQNLTMGQIIGSKNPVVPICLDKNLQGEFYQRIDNNYPYLKKALSLSEIHYCPDSKYILIYDTKINERTFDSIKFEIPQGTKSLKIYFATDAYEKGKVTQELFLSDNNENFLQLVKIFEDLNNGTSIHSMELDSAQRLCNLIISNYSRQRNYAVAIELIMN